MIIASFDVDCQKTFTPICPDELPIPKGHHIVPELNRQASLATYRVGSKDAHHPKAVWQASEKHPPLTSLNQRNADCYWPSHAIVGTKGFELLDDLPDPIEYDFFVWKGVELDLHPYGACYHDLAERHSTGVIEFLKLAEVQTILLGGLAFDHCVKQTALQLQRAGFQTIINLAATRGLSPSGVEAAKKILLAAGVQFVASSAYLSDLLKVS